ncbi:MAG: glutamate--tRNA ligase, partial [Chitinophagales bacterium]
MTRVRTRFAPSPTGPLHIGGVRTALYSYLFAKKHGGDFLLRIEDTDTARTVAGSEDVINESLNWCGIIPDEGILQGGPHAPYRQSERKEMYRQYAEQLVQLGKAYLAFDSEDDIKVWREKSASENKGISDAYNYTTRSQMRNSLTLSAEEVSKLLADKVAYVVRLKVDSQDHVSFQDIIRDEVKFKSSQLDDRVLLKSDGMPTYHLANVVDDHLMEISHVIRGEEWLASTPHHILLYKAFGWNQPQFAHLPLFLKPDGKGKLSKRDGDRLGFPVFCTQFVNPDTGDVTEGFREKGFERDAFVNFIAMLGWNDGTERELFDMDALIENFSLERVHKAGAKFNFEKAIWFNQQYLRNLPTKELVNSCSDEI